MLAFDRILSENFNTKTAKAIPQVWHAFLRKVDPAPLLFKRDNTVLPVSSFCNLEQYRPQFYSQFLGATNLGVPAIQVTAQNNATLPVIQAKQTLPVIQANQISPVVQTNPKPTNVIEMKRSHAYQAHRKAGLRR
jgi:hypothetical protein